MGLDHLGEIGKVGLHGKAWKEWVKFGHFPSGHYLQVAGSRVNPKSVRTRILAPMKVCAPVKIILPTSTHK